MDTLRRFNTDLLAPHEGATFLAGDSAPPAVFDQLRGLADREDSRAWVVIDHARLYIDSDFASGPCAPSDRRWELRSALDECLRLFGKTHVAHLVLHDNGYFVLRPQASQCDMRDFLAVIPGDGRKPASTNPYTVGATSISIQRRNADHRFSTRYFVGNGLDVGGGGDSLALFQEFFPLARNITTYDMEQGDAQLLRNVRDESFDFVYSSHCLEHMRDASVALGNWLRVLKPGGHMVVEVPDEDLYEQGHWPSRFNSDHKLTFTIFKRESWSPVSINVLDLLAQFSDSVTILSVALVDNGFRYGLVGTNIDQTCTPLAECGIEFILKKR